MKRKADDIVVSGDWAPVVGEPGPAKRERGEGDAYYGRLALEPLATADEQWLVRLECFSAGWFDRLQPDLSDLPRWRTVAQVAKTCVVELALPGQLLLALLNAAFGQVADPADAAGRWLRLWLVLDTRAPSGLPVRVFLPPPGSTDPARAADSGREIDGASLTRVAAADDAAAKLARLGGA